MIQKTHRSAFTLIEILVVISIIAIVIMGTTSFNFQNFSTKQKLDTDIIHIISFSEEIRNAALIGKGVETPIRIPRSWKIIFNSNSISALYSFDDSTYTSYNSWQSSNNMSLFSIQCENRDGSSTETSTNVEIVYSGQQGSIVNGCSLASANKIRIQYGNAQFGETIIYDLLTGVIE